MKLFFQIAHTYFKHIHLLSWFHVLFLTENTLANVRYWHLLACVCCIMLPPNNLILSYLNLHLKRQALMSYNEEGKFAQFCIKVCWHNLPWFQLFKQNTINKKLISSRSFQEIAVWMTQMIPFHFSAYRELMTQREENFHLPTRK